MRVARTGRAIRIPAIGPVSEVLNCPLEYPMLNSVAIGPGNLMEIVRPDLAEEISSSGLNFALVVDEEGLSKGLPINHRATILCSAFRAVNQYIRGDALLLAEDLVDYDDETGKYQAPDVVGLPDDVTVSAVRDRLAALAVAILNTL